MPGVATFLPGKAYCKAFRQMVFCHDLDVTTAFFFVKLCGKTVLNEEISVNINQKKINHTSKLMEIMSIILKRKYSG